ncbi:MAG: hypothetical protein HF962_08115 [Sulfurovum sp.]|nr:hypothetical protein [Sulfurovum sp.]
MKLITLALSVAIAFIIGCGGGSGGEHNLSNSDPANNSHAAKLTPPEGFKMIYMHMVYGIQAGGLFGLTDEIVALFDDGTYTYDLANLYSKGKEYSKANKPKRWGQWRFDAQNKFEIKEHDDSDYDTAISSAVADSGSIDQRLNGCASSIRSSDGLGLGPLVGNVRQFCFLPDGRYAHSSTSFGSSTDVIIGSSDERSGTYRIDKYMIEFKPYGGEVQQAAFAFLADDKSHITINGVRFINSNDLDLSASANDLPFNGMQADPTLDSNDSTSLIIKIHILQKVPALVCTSQLFVSKLKEQGYDIIGTQELGGDVDCTYYSTSSCNLEVYSGENPGANSCIIKYK